MYCELRPHLAKVGKSWKTSRRSQELSIRLDLGAPNVELPILKQRAHSL